LWASGDEQRGAGDCAGRREALDADPPCRRRCGLWLFGWLADGRRLAWFGVTEVLDCPVLTNAELEYFLLLEFVDEVSVRIGWIAPIHADLMSVVLCTLWQQA
jgi:hypothetical protein